MGGLALIAKKIERRDSGVTLGYYSHGDGDEMVLLLHGFGSDSRECWFDTLWVRDAIRTGMKTVAVDLRGHGRSDSPRVGGSYASKEFIGDIQAVLDSEKPCRVSVIGFSLGATIALRLARCDRRITAVAAVGVGESLASSAFPENCENVILGRSFPSSEREEILCRLALRRPEKVSVLAKIAREFDAGEEAVEQGVDDVPVMVISGGRDPFATNPTALGANFSRFELVEIPRADHVGTLVNRAARQAGVQFAARALTS